MEEFIIGCEEAGVAPRTTHRRPPAPPRRQQPAGRWPELKRRVREWIEPRRTPVHVGPRGMAFLQWLEGVKRRLGNLPSPFKRRRGSAKATVRQKQVTKEEFIPAFEYWGIANEHERAIMLTKAGIDYGKARDIATTASFTALSPEHQALVKKSPDIRILRTYPKTAAGEWWRWWRKTEVVPKGTVLYHGTVQEFDPMDLQTPAWFSTSQSVAEHFMQARDGEEGQERVLQYRAVQPIRLPRIDGREDFDAMGEKFGIEELMTGCSSEEMAEGVCSSVLPGWIIPHNYPDGDDILLCSMDSIEPVPQPEPEEGSLPPGAWRDKEGLPGHWTREGDATVYHMTPEEIAEQRRKKRGAADEPADVGGLTRNPTSLTIFRGEGGSSRRGGHYWSPDKGWAAQFTQSGRAEELLQAEIMAKDIYEPSPLPYAGDPEEVEAAVHQARKAGFKAVWLDEGAREPRSVYVFGNSALY
jgi:hypothetical protein